MDITIKTILHIIPFAHLGGTEKDCLYFIQADKEHKHLVLVLDKSGPMVIQWGSMGAEVHILPILDLSDATFTKALYSELKNKGFAAILYWSAMKLPLVRYALRDHKCRLAVHVGNPCQLSPLSTIKQVVYHIFYQSGIETCLFACSEYVKKTLAINPYYNKFQMRVSLNPVQLLPENPYHTRLLTNESEILIGMTARLDTIKDHKTLLLAFQIVLKSYPGGRLWLIGDGDLRKTLEELVDVLKIKEHVVFWGRVENVYELLQKIDIFVYSTTQKEGLGNAVSEAMSNGVPCIISDLPMMREIAGDGETTVYFKTGNYNDLAIRILNLIQNEYVREQLSVNAFIWAKLNFDASRYVKDRFAYLLH